MATNNPPQVLSPSLPKAPDDIHLGLTRGDQYRGISQEMSEDQKDFKFPLRANSDNEERRAEEQSLWDAWANGITSRGLSIGTKVVEGGAILLSAPYAIATGSLNNLYDNALVNTIASSDDWLRETFPVYGTKANYHGQSFLSQLGTVKFWAEDAMDGVAFALSAYIGGAGAIAGLKGLAKVTKLTKVLKGTKAFKGLANMSSEAAVKNGIEVIASTAYNTITEAGFEANDAKKQLQEEYAINKYNQPFDELSNIQQNEISNEVAVYAKNVFVGNTLALAIPNLWQSKIFFGKNVGSGANKLFKSLQKGDISPKDLVKNKKVWKGVVKGATEGIVAEGIWEENIQTAMSNYEVRRMNRDLFNEKDTGDGRISGYINEWFKNFTTDEGLKSMFLGALIGAPMGAVSGGRENAQANKDVTKAKLRYSNFINRLKNVDNRFEENVKSFYRVYEKDEEVDEVNEDGKPTGNKKNQRTKSYINPETGKPEVDLEKVTQLFYQTLNDKSLLDEAVTATMNNDPLHLEVVKQEAVARRVYSVLTDPDFDTIEEAVEYLKKQPDVDLSAFPGLDTEFKEQSEEVKKEIDYYAKILKEAQESLADIKDFQEDKEWGGFKRKLTKAHLLNMSALKALERKTNVVIEEVSAALEAIVAEHPDDYHERKDYKDLDALRNLYYDLDMSKTFITNKAERERLFKEYKQEQNLLEELREKHETLKKKENVNDDELLESEYSIEEAELLSGEFQRSNEKDEVLAQREKSNRILAVSEDERDRLAEFGMYNQFKYDAGKHIQTQQEFNKKWGEQEIPSDEDIEAAYELSTTAVDKNTLPEGEINPVELLSDEQKNTLSKYFPGTNITDVSPEQAEELYNRLKAIKDEYDIDKIGLDNSKNENKIIDKVLRGDRTGDSNLLNFLKRKIANKVFDKVREILNAFENNPEYAESEYIAKVIKQLLRLRKIFSTEIRKELLESAEFEGFIEDIDSAIAMLTEKLNLAIQNQNNKSAKQIESFKNESEYRFETLGADVEESTPEKIEDNKIFPGLLNFLMKIPTIKKIIIEAFSDTEHPKHKIYYERIVEIIKKDKILSQKIKDFLEAHKHSLIEQAGEAYGNFISHAKLKEQYKQLAKYAASNPINTLVALIRFNTSERKDDAPQDNAIDNFIRSRDLIKLRRDLKEGKPTGYYVTTEQLSALVEVFYQLQMANDLQSDINSEYDHNEEYKNEDEILLEEIARIAKLNKENPGGRIFEIVPTFQQMFAIRDIIRWYKRKFNSGKYFTGWIYQKGIAGSGKTAIVYKWAIKILKLKENQIFSVAHTKEATDNINSVHSSSNSSGVLSKNLEASHISDDVKLLVIDEVGALDNQELAKIAIIVHEINKKRTDDNKLKVLALGDPNQINRSNFGIPVIDDWINIVTNTTTQENNNVLRELKNIESAFPLTVPYRSRVGILNTLADTFMDNFSKVSNLVLKANRAIGNRTVTGAHKGSVNEMVKQINAAKDNGRSKVIIVADINNVPKELKDTGLPIKDFVQVQGSTIDEAYIYIPRSAFAEMAEKNFNDAMYTAISRATEYVFLADTVGNMTWYEDSSVNESSTQFEKDMTDNFDNYTENLNYELGENPKNPPKDKPEDKPDNPPEGEPQTEDTGVAELFESNTELANEVYEALGFGQENNTENKKADIERRRQEELKNLSPENLSVMASDYLLTGGVGSILSSDYFIQALMGSFINASSKIAAIRNKYANEVNNKYGNLSDFVKTDLYNQMMEEIRTAVNSSYSTTEAQDILDQILGSPSGVNPKLGNQLSVKLDAINATTEKINAKYDAELAGLEAQVTPQQKQQAQQLYSQYLEQNPNGNIEGFKQWNNRQQQINELFESNFELANQVYEALGFNKEVDKFTSKYTYQEREEWIKKYKEAIPNIENGKQLIKHLQTISNRNDGDIKAFANLIMQLSGINTTLKELLNNPNLYAEEDSVGDQGIYRWNYYTKYSVNQIGVEHGHFTQKFGNYDETFLHELIHNLTVGAVSKESDQYNEKFAKKIESIFDEFVSKFGNKLIVDKEKIDYLNVKLFELNEIKSYIESTASIDIYNRFKTDNNYINIRIGNNSIIRGSVKDIANINKEKIINKIQEQIEYYENNLNRSEKGEKKFYYFLSNTFETKTDKISEFLATFISNESFRNDLKLIPYQKKTLYDKIIEYLSNLFGLTKEDTLYNEFVLTLSDFISKNDYSELAKQTQKVAYENRLQTLEQQKQQAQQKFQEYVNSTGKQDIEGFKKFVTQPTPIVISDNQNIPKYPSYDEPEGTQEINLEKSINAEPTEEELDDYVVSDTFDDTGEDEDNAGEIHPTPTIISDHQITPKYPSYDAVKRKDKKDTEPRVQIGDTVYGVVVKDSRTGTNRVLIIGAIGKNKYRILAELDETEILDLVSKGELNYTAYADANPIKGAQFVRNSIVNIGTNFTSDTGENTPLLFKGKLGEGSMPLTYHYGSKLSHGENVLTKTLAKLVRLFKNNLFNAVDYAVIIPVSAKALQKIFPSTTNNANNSLSLKEHVGEREITDELIEDLIANGQIVTDANGKVVYNNETYDTLEKLKQDIHKKEFEGNLYKGTPYIIMRAISNKGKEVFQYIRLNPAKVSKDSKYYFFRGEGANRKLHSKSLMQPIQEFRDALKEITNFFVADGGSFLGDMSFNRTLQEFKHFFSIDPNTKEIIKNKAFTYEMYKANIEKGNKSQYKHLLPTYDILSEELFNKIANSTAIDKIIKGYYGVSQRDKAHTHKEFVELYGNLEPSGSDNNVFIDTFEGKKYAFAPQKNNPSVGAIIEYEYSNGKETSKGEIEKEDFLKGGLGPAQSSLDLIAKANKSIKGKQLRVTKKLGDGRITTKAPNLLDDIMISNSYNAILNKMIKESEVEAKQDWFKSYLEKEQWMIENKIATIEQLQEIKERDNIKWTKIDDEMLDAIVEYDSEGNNNSLRLPLDANTINTLGKDMHANKKALSDMLGTNLEGISPTKIVIDLDNNEREENLQKKEVPKKDSKETKESIKDVPKENLEQDVNSFVSKELTDEQQKALKKIDDNNNIKFKC